VIRPGVLAACAAVTLAGSAIGQATAGPQLVRPAVVAVEARGAHVATGFVVDRDRVVTVAHALSDGPVVVRGADGVARRARVTRRDEALDLALLAAPGVPSAGSPPSLGGARVIVQRGGETMTELAAVRRRIDARVRNAATDEVARRPALELATSIRAGDSGAPVVDAAGRVAGIVFARSREREGLVYAVDAAALPGLTE
jgi:S1-C subfamily serine protease